MVLLTDKKEETERVRKKWEKWKERKRHLLLLLTFYLPQTLPVHIPHTLVHIPHHHPIASPHVVPDIFLSLLHYLLWTHSSLLILMAFVLQMTTLLSQLLRGRAYPYKLVEKCCVGLYVRGGRSEGFNSVLDGGMFCTWGCLGEKHCFLMRNSCVINAAHWINYGLRRLLWTSLGPLPSEIIFNIFLLLVKCMP